MACFPTSYPTSPARSRVLPTLWQGGSNERAVETCQPLLLHRQFGWSRRRLAITDKDFMRRFFGWVGLKLQPRCRGVRANAGSCRWTVRVYG